MTEGNGDNYEVGYGKPPMHSRFQKGRSGNPVGRPRGSRSLQALLAAELNKQVAVREGGKVRSMSKRGALIASLVNKALQGDARAINLLVSILQRPEPEAAEVRRDPVTLDHGDEEIISAFMRRKRGHGVDGG